VLHRLARLYEMAIQGAAKGATKCNMWCYIFPNFRETRFELSVEELKTATNRFSPSNLFS